MPNTPHTHTPTKRKQARDESFQNNIGSMFHPATPTTTPPRKARPAAFNECGIKVKGEPRPSGPQPPHHSVRLLRKEVIQPHLPVRLPCYDFVPIASPTFDNSLPQAG